LELVALNRPCPFIFIGREVWTLVEVEIHEDLARFLISYSDSIIPDVLVTLTGTSGSAGTSGGLHQNIRWASMVPKSVINRKYWKKLERA